MPSLHFHLLHISFSLHSPSSRYLKCSQLKHNIALNLKIKIDFYGNEMKLRCISSCWRVCIVMGFVKIITLICNWDSIYFFTLTISIRIQQAIGLSVVKFFFLEMREWVIASVGISSSCYYGSTNIFQLLSFMSLGFMSIVDVHSKGIGTYLMYIRLQHITYLIDLWELSQMIMLILSSFQFKFYVFFYISINIMYICWCWCRRLPYSNRTKNVVGRMIDLGLRLSQL